MKIDTIDVSLESSTFEDGTRYESINLVLNGETVKGPFNAYAFGLTGVTKRGTMEIRTCGCGVSGCAGIFDGTKIKPRRYTVEWRDIDSGLPKRFYSFLRADYEAAVVKTFSLMRQVAEIREARGASRDSENEAYDGILSFWNVEEFEDTVAWTKRWSAEWI
jgi:hypothetical protein